jgi:predicted lipid-binding transport protein (Tim44 family)
MRLIILFSATLSVSLLSVRSVQAQAGRLPRFTRPPGGGGLHFPHIFPRFGGSIDETVVWVLVTLLVAVLLAIIGYHIGRSLAARKGRVRPSEPAAWQAGFTPPDAPPPDLILTSAEVEEKARETERLLETLSRYDGAFGPVTLCEFITSTFLRLQRCWEWREYNSVQELLTPALLAQHKNMLLAMRQQGVINRIENLRVNRLEFVQLSCPGENGHQEVTALITFEAKVYFVHEGTGAFQSGSLQVLPYQEFWVFRRDGEAWKLHAIERSHLSSRLRAPNRVEGMAEAEPLDAS